MQNQNFVVVVVVNSPNLGHCFLIISTLSTSYHLINRLPYLTLKAPITAAADDIHIYFFIVFHDDIYKYFFIVFHRNNA